MENYSRYVIDLLKQSFSDYIATGEVDAERLTEAQKRLSLELDRRKVGKFTMR